MPIQKRFTKSGKERWEAYIQVKVGGRWQAKSKTCKTRQEAEIAEAKLRLKYQGWQGDEPPLFEYVFEEWKQEYRTKVSEKTFKNSVGVINNHFLPYLQGVPIDEIRRRHVRNCLIRAAQKGRSRGMIQKIRAGLSLVFEYAIEVEYVHSNPCRGIKIDFGQETEKARPLTEEEQKKLKNGPESYIKDAALISLYTGLRRAEVCGLTEDCVFLREGYLWVKQQGAGTRQENFYLKEKTKTETGHRFIPLTATAQKFFKHLIIKNKESRLAGNASKTLITNSKGKPVIPKYLGNRYGDYAKRIALPPKFHWLRHTFATELYRKGLDAKLRASILGHTRSTLTDNAYTHPDPQDILKQFRKIEKAGP